MLGVDLEGMKKYINETGIKQKVVGEKTGIGECKLSLMLQGKRKMEAGEYASICRFLGVPMDKFLKPRKPEPTAV